MAADKVNKIHDLKSEIVFLTQRVQELVSQIDVEVLSLANSRNAGGSESAVKEAAPKGTPDRGTDEEQEEAGAGGPRKVCGSWSDEESDHGPVGAEDYQSQASVSEEEEEADIFRNHLERYGIKMTFAPILTVRNAKAYTCSVFGFTDYHVHLQKVGHSQFVPFAKGVAKTKRAAKRKAMIAVAKTIVRKQEEGILPTDIQPFACDELANLMSMMASSDTRDYVKELRSLCQGLGAPPPEYAVLAAPNHRDCKTFTVKCSALGYDSVGTHGIKRKAKTISAREILKMHEGTKALD